MVEGEGLRMGVDIVVRERGRAGEGVSTCVGMLDKKYVCSYRDFGICTVNYFSFLNSIS